jgi:biotin-(acetyl-CoA carboxylase) ligase
MIEGRKLAGVLPELRDDRLVVGVGVNVNMTAGGLPSQARIPATSLRIERGREVDRIGLLIDLLAELERRYDAFERDGFSGLQRDELRGRYVRLRGGRTGMCEGVDELGRLVVGGHPHTSAEVEQVEAV